MQNSNHEKSFRNFSQKSLNYFRKATNTLDPRSISPSKSKKNVNLEKINKKDSKRNLVKVLTKSFHLRRRKPIEIQDLLYPGEFYEFDQNIEKKNDRAIALTLVNLVDNENFKKIYDIQKIINAFSKEMKDRNFEDISYIVNSILYSKLSQVFKETRKDKIKFSFLLYKLARRIEYQLTKKGDTIIRIGETGENFYLILKGNVHILKLVQTTKEMNLEEYLILLHKLKKENEFYRLKKILLINRIKCNIEFEQIDQIYELMIRKKLGIFLQQHPNYAQIEDFLSKYGKSPADFNLDSQEIKSLFNLNTNPKKKSILVNNQRIDVLNHMKNKKAFFVMLKKLESYSSNEESDCDSEKEKGENSISINIKLNNNSKSSYKNNNNNNNLDDSLLDEKSKHKIQKAIIDNFRLSKLNLENLNQTLDKLENLTHVNETSQEQQLASTESALALKSFDSADQAAAAASQSQLNKSNLLLLTKEELRMKKQVEKAKETLTQIFHIDINNTNKKFFIQSFIKTQILNENLSNQNNINKNKQITNEKNNILTHNLDENKLFTLYENQIFYSLGEGQFFGDYALEKNTFRTASVIAGDEDAHFAVINKKLYYDLIYEEKIKLSNLHKDFLYSSLFKEFVKKADFEKKYFEHFIYEEYSKNFVITKEKEEMQFVYFIFEGSVLLHSRKSYFDIQSDLDAFEALSPEIQAEISEAYSPVKQLEKSEAFRFKLKLFSKELNEKKNAVGKIISRQEIFGLENFVFNLPSYSTIVVNSNTAAVFKINIKLLRKMLNAESDLGTRIIANFAQVKVKNLIHRLFEVKKSFIDILKANNSQNNAIKELFQQLNDKNKFVNRKLYLSNKKNQRNVAFNDKSNFNSSIYFNNENIKSGETKNLCVYDEYDENYLKKVSSEMENMNLKSLMRSVNNNNNLNGNISRREKASSRCNSPCKKNTENINILENKTLAKYDFFSNMELNQSQANEFTFLKNLSRNNPHLNNLKKSVKRENNSNFVDKEKQEKDKELRKNKLRRVLTIVENESEINYYDNKSTINLSGFEKISDNEKEEKVIIKKKNEIESKIENLDAKRDFVLNEIKDRKSISARNNSSHKNINKNFIFKNHHSKKFSKESLEEELMKKLNQSKNYFSKVIPNQLNLKMKINLNNTHNLNFMKNESSHKENNYSIIMHENDNEYLKKINFQNLSLNNNDNSNNIQKEKTKNNLMEKLFESKDLKTNNNIRGLMQKFTNEKDAKDSVFLTIPNIRCKSNEDPVEYLQNKITPVNKNENNLNEKNIVTGNSVEIKNLSNKNESPNFKNKKKILKPIKLKNKIDNPSSNQNIINCNINEVYFNLKDFKNQKSLDLDTIKENSEIQDNQIQQHQIKENSEPINENLIHNNQGLKKLFKKKNNIFLNRLTGLIKEKQTKEKARQINLSKTKPKCSDYNNFSNINKDTVFSQKNYELFNFGLIGTSRKLKNESDEQLEKMLKSKIRYLSFDKKAINITNLNKEACFTNNNNNSQSNSSYVKYQAANKNNLKSLKGHSLKLNKYKLFKPIEKIENTQKAFLNERSNSKPIAKDSVQDKKKITKKPKIIANNITNINLTVVNLIDEKIFDVDLLEKFKNTSKYNDVRYLCDNIKSTERKTEVTNKVCNRKVIKMAAKKENKKISLMNLIKNNELKSVVSISETGAGKGKR